MNFKKIIKGIMGVGVVGGVAYLAYKVGECNGEMNERVHSLANTEDDDIEIVEDDEDDEDDLRLYDNMVEPDDGCLAPANKKQDTDDFEFMPIELLNIKGVTIGQLRGLLLYLTTLKKFCKKNVKEYLGIDDDITVDTVLDLFIINGYVKRSEKDKYKYRAVTNIADCARIIGW